MKSVYIYKYPVCTLGITEENGVICRIFFEKNIDKILSSGSYEKKETPLIKKTAVQLGEYFEGKLKKFDIPLVLQGTGFQVKVWKALLKVPYGKTCSYGELAAKTGNPKASRAVGMANNRNPLVIIVPCHRVIGSNGSLTGYDGGLELKQKLLELESYS